MTISQSTPAHQAEQEEWRPVVGYEGWYEVSNLGRVRRVGAGRGSTVGRILRTRPDRNGYRLVELHRERRRHGENVHRLVAAAFLGPRPAGMEVNHRDRDKMNSALANLEYVTPSENVAHAYRTGVVPRRGERHGMAKLTAEQVREIRAARGTLKRIAAQYGVAMATIHMIRSGQTWGHLDQPSDVRADDFGRPSRPCGSANHNAKLSENAVRQIRASAETDTALAARYGVSISVVWNVRHRKTWRHVE